MSLTTYDGLKSEIVDYLHRADVTTATAAVDSAIDLLEAWASRNLRTRWQAQEATATAAEYMELPSDFAQMRDIQWQGSPRVNLRYMTPEMADVYDTSGSTSISKFYTVVGNQIRLIPAPSSGTTIRMAYWKTVPALTSGNTTNWLLTNHPDAYLYGSLMHLRGYIEDDARAQQAMQAWGRIVAEIEREGKRSMYGGALEITTA